MDANVIPYKRAFNVEARTCCIKAFLKSETFRLNFIPGLTLWGLSSTPELLVVIEIGLALFLLQLVRLASLLQKKSLVWVIVLL